MDPEKLIRPLVRSLHGYVPGEQPKVRRLVKLNTNENPYPPSPMVLQAIQKAVDGRLRLYPNPSADALRLKLAKLHGCHPENILVGNGSDELLAMAVRAFVDPLPPTSDGRAASSAHLNRSTVQALFPSYSLYPVLAEIHGARFHSVPLAANFDLPPSLVSGTLNPKKTKHSPPTWQKDAALSFITTPNAPTGRAFRLGDLNAICEAQRGVVVLDEAYVDFAPEHAMALALRHPNTLVARTFSKAYSLCYLRVGYMVGHPVLIDALHRIRDSYNVNGLGQIAAEATLSDLPYYRANFKKVIATRQRVTRELALLGFEVFPSAANFLLVRPPGFPAKDWLQKLRNRHILVRWFSHPEVDSFLRISIGSDSEMDELLQAVSSLLRSAPSRKSRGATVRTVRGKGRNQG